MLRKDSLARTSEHRERFVSEARSCSALNHPDITTIHEIGEADGELKMVEDARSRLES